MLETAVTELTADVVTERLETVRGRVARASEAAGRDPASVRILAVTKGHPVDAVLIAQGLKLRDIGESRVQEAQAKRSALPGADLSWHMIGHLQRNKARVAASLFDTVHSVDSVALATALARHRTDLPSPLRVYVEVELTGLAGRTGILPAAAAVVLAELRSLPGLTVVGLMTIAPPGAAEVAADCFGRLRTLRDAVSERTGMQLEGLSMGMSGDFEVAIANGATVIRLGHALFGDASTRGR